MKGGARTRSGPAPDPNALRRNRPKDAGEWTELPAEGRTDPAPDWPLPLKPAAAELVLWNREWRRPQALMWESQGQELEVALYVQAVLITQGDHKAADRTLVRQMMDSLGISTPGLRAARWKIVEQPEVSAQPSSSAASIKDRLAAIAPVRSL